jgi:hypothetical protein
MYLLSDSTGKVHEIVPVLDSNRYIHEFNQLFVLLGFRTQTEYS